MSEIFSEIFFENIFGNISEALSQVCDGRVPGGEGAEGGGGGEDEALLCHQEPQCSHKVS